MKFFTPKSLYIAVGIILFIILVTMVILLTGAKPESPKKINTEPTRSAADPDRIVPPIIRNAPSLPPEQGGGIDENSSLVQGSINEIQKLYPYLPYSKEFVSSTGVEVSILIPRQSLQSNSWTLTAQVFGINYNTSPDQPDYETMRAAFIEASSKVFKWVEQNGADPRKIIYVWGDKKFIQDQTIKWLRE